jgi:hypothetical protein
MELKVPFLYISFSDAAHIINLRCNKMRGASDHMVVGFTTTYAIQSVPITTNVVSSNPTQAIQHYVIKY